MHAGYPPPRPQDPEHFDEAGIIKLGDHCEGVKAPSRWPKPSWRYYMSPRYSATSHTVTNRISGLLDASSSRWSGWASRRATNSLVQKILRANFAPIPSTASKDVRALIKSMLALSPSARPSVNDVLAMPFIRKEMGSYIQNQVSASGLFYRNIGVF